MITLHAVFLLYIYRRSFTAPLLTPNGVVSEQLGAAKAITAVSAKNAEIEATN